MRLALLLLLAVAGFLHATAAAAPRPNVIFILADDLGWADTTPYGHTTFHRTPHLERLARRGMLFTRAYSASPLCSPTRSAILTGLSPARTGITTPNGHVPEVNLKAKPGTRAAPDQKAVQPVPVTRLKPEYRTLAEALKEAGYATGHFGKWHLGTDPYSPLQHGFDIDLPHHPGPGPAGSFVAPWKFARFQERTPGEHIEDRMAAEAVAWMETNRSRPFFLNYWMFSVHAPFNAKASLIEKHRARVDPRNPQRSPTYAAMLESMDDAVGTLLDALDRLQLADRTVIVFTSDNGGNMYSEVDGGAPTSNAPLRGGKATVYEGGTRVPCLIAWPGVTRPGSRSDVPIQSEDYYPTLLAGLGLEPAPGQRFDGTNLLAALRGATPARPPLFQYFPHNPPVPHWLPPAVTVHHEDWKLIRLFHGGDLGAHRHLLFNLREDLGETNNLATRLPDKVAALDRLIEQFLTETKAVTPVRNPAFDPAQYQPEREGQPAGRNARAKPATPAARASTGAEVEDPALQGWKQRQCQATAKDGVLHVTARGNAPFLGLAAGPLGPGARLRFRIQCDGGSGQVAWLPSPTTPPADAPKPSTYSLKAGDWAEIAAPIPAPANQAGIVRLFLPVQDTPVQIDWIELTHGETRRRWDFGTKP
ncbi:MAG: hypothetical protein RJA22_3136 [Verrucomicrobiota bacterium]